MISARSGNRPITNSSKYSTRMVLSCRELVVPVLGNLRAGNRPFGLISRKSAGLSYGPTSTATVQTSVSKIRGGLIQYYRSTASVNDRRSETSYTHAIWLSEKFQLDPSPLAERTIASAEQRRSRDVLSVRLGRLNSRTSALGTVRATSVGGGNGGTHVNGEVDEMVRWQGRLTYIGGSEER